MKYMNAVDAREYIHKVMEAADKAVIKSNNYILWFRDQAQEVHAYDTIDPIRGVRAILEKNPTFQFVHLDQMPDANSTRTIVTNVRKVREFRERLPKHLEPVEAKS